MCDRSLVRVVLAATWAAWAIPLSAQAPPSSVPPPAQSPAPQVTAGWQNGFVIQSADGHARLQIGLLVHADGRFALDDTDETITNTFSMRRLRPYLRGRVADRFEFYLNPDFAGGTLVVQDAYIDTRFSSAFRLRVGKAKTPFGHERQHSASSMLFMERGFPTLIAPNRDVGVQVLGDLGGGIVSYAVALSNGAPDSSSVDVDTNDGKDAAGRIVVRPFNRTPAVPLGGLGFALSGSTGMQRGASSLPSYRTAVVQPTFFAYAGATADGRRNRYSPYAFYYLKAFGAFAEYTHTELPVRKDTTREVVAHRAWQAVASVVLTGESGTEAGVRPRNDFDFGNGHWGAFQVAVRYTELSVDRAAIDLGLAAAGSSRRASAWTAGLNWYLTPNFKYVVNFDRVVFDGETNTPRGPENVVAFRTQLSF